MSIQLNSPIEVDSLVLYKNNPALVLNVDTRLTVKLDTGKIVKVRINDVVLLHPGPLNSLDQLKPLTGEVSEARELISGEVTTLPELAELIYGNYTPQSAWACWKIVDEGLYFYGTANSISARSTEEFESEKKSRETKVQEKQLWAEFMGRIKTARLLPGDKEKFTEVEEIASGIQRTSRILKDTGRQNSSESAYRMLLDLGIWNETVNPYPGRCGLSYPGRISVTALLPDEQRIDLTGLDAYAIDDEGSNDPDDAISFEDDKLWIHVADVAAIVKPDTELDLQARQVGASLYLPEKTIPMLPDEITEKLGLGLQPVSPAFSFCIGLDNEGEIVTVKILPSLIKAKRLTYLEAEEMLDRSPINSILKITKKYRKRRESRGAAHINLPEVKVKVENGDVIVTPLKHTESRQLVTDAMLMAGEAAAEFAIKNEIPFPFTTQSRPEVERLPVDLAGMFSYRKELKPGQIKCIPEPHAGLGLKYYSRVTSPLRRYPDLVVHQQLRAFLQNGKLQNEQEIINKNGLYEAVIGNIRKAERLSNLHWIIIYLMHHRKWRDKAVILEKNERRAVVIVPALGIEARVNLKQDAGLNDEILLGVSYLDLPDLTVRFHHITL